MKSIFIPLMGVVVFANQKMEQANKFYDGLADIIVNTNGGYTTNNCETQIADTLALLCDSFEYCEVDQSNYGTASCLNKDQFKTQELGHMCGHYDTFKDDIKVHSEDTYDNSEISLTYTWEVPSNDNFPCTLKITEEHVLNFNDNGLITKLYNKQVNREEICPQQEQPPMGNYGEQPPMDNYGEQPPQGSGYGAMEAPKAPIAVSDYAFTPVNKAVIINVLDNDYDPDQPELPGNKALMIDSFEKHGKKGSVEKEGDKLKYIPYDDECGSDKFIYTIIDVDDGLTDSANVHIHIQCPQQYGQEPPQVYGAEEPVYGQAPVEGYGADYNDNKNKINEINNQFGRVCSKSNDDSMNDISMKEKFCENIEYSLVCNEESYDCDVFGPKKKYGREEVLDEFSQYENLFDDADIYTDANNMFNIKYRKGECQGELKFEVKIEYDSENQCISKWTDYLDNSQVSDHDCDNSPAKLMEKLATKCHFDDEIIYEPEPVYGEEPEPVQGYEADAPVIDTPPMIDYDGADYDNKNKINEINNQFGRVCSKSNDDSMYDISMKEKFCENIEYSRVCNGQSYDCDVIGPKNLYGRGAVLEEFSPYENLLDDAEIYTDDSNMFNIKYRKGKCQGELKFGVKIEYDSENECISKWTDYLDNSQISDQDCDNSQAKLLEKLVTKCHFDDENNYAPEPVYGEEPVQGYGADAPAIDTPPMTDYDGMVMKREYKNLNVDVVIPDGEDGTYGGYMKVLDTMELEYVANDVSALDNRIRKELAVEETQLESITLIEAYYKDISNNRMRYRCLLMYVAPAPEPVQQEDGSVTQVGGAEAIGYIEYDAVSVNMNGNDYNEKEKEYGISEMTNKLGRVLCKKDSDKMHDIDMQQKLCKNMEYKAVCNNDHYDCSMWVQTTNGRDEFLKIFEQWEDTFDDVQMVIDEGDDVQMFIMEYRTGKCEGIFKQRVDLQYDSYQGCVSQWIDYFDEVQIADTSGLISDHDPSNWVEKLQNECVSDDDTNGYTPQQPSTGYEQPSTGYGQPSTGYGQDSGLDAMVEQYETDNYGEQPATGSGYASTGADGTKRLVKMKNGEDTLRLFYKAAFDCRLKKNAGNTQLLDEFMGYLCDSAQLCVVHAEPDSESCYDKDEIREMMSDRYVDDNEKIDYEVKIISNKGSTIHSKCTSHRRKPNGCIVTKEEEDECVFNDDGIIKSFRVLRSNTRTKCDDDNNGNNYEQE